MKARKRKAYLRFPAFN